MKKIIFILTLLFTFFGSYSQQTDVFDIARKGTVEQMRTLYEKTPEIINSVNDKKSSPLILSTYLGNTAVALFLADKVKNIDYNSGYGTAVMAAVMSADIAVLQKLISLKANLNLTDVHGKTALMYAVFFNKNEIAQLLVKSGADKNLKDKDGKSALDIAQYNKNTDLIILLDQ
ncbi:ankyrin repeat domain-containing protein [Flavobacterium silvaticum]|uniref:Ankyrin repeat domain-containing protein n=1 Tax=Flavobacterium silvaticum TaxID=1852020 RepID=A0A972G2R1_9FLAO|nr:ankyrin repeat domain-containing protein [Flavobacterium silvaticum]NMH29406.1 ankyrin repeat domain-containing protein [Flavobacterium silvaticum]